MQSPDGDCDNDGVKNRYDADDDNDLLTDATEVAIGTVPCNADSDGDGVEDGYEFQSAKDLNDDEYQHPNQNLPYPGKQPVPEPAVRRRRPRLRRRLADARERAGPVALQLHREPHGDAHADRG